MQDERQPKLLMSTLQPGHGRNKNLFALFMRGRRVFVFINNGVGYGVPILIIHVSWYFQLIAGYWQ